MSARSKKDLPSGLYEDDGQRNFGESKIDQMSRHSGINVKGYLPKDQEKEMNRLTEMESREKQIDAIKKDPTLAASLNGNKPARGARIDKELMEDDQKILEKMNRKKMNEITSMSSKYL
ncbi:hypothetical protein V8F20_001281 [Naviculisporaceae sp. PSN 640]